MLKNGVQRLPRSMKPLLGYELRCLRGNNVSNVRLMHTQMGTPMGSQLMNFGIVMNMTKDQRSIPMTDSMNFELMKKEVGILNQITIKEPSSEDVNMQLDSVLRKRKKKMKKHKLRKRRRKERAEKRKLSQGR